MARWLAVWRIGDNPGATILGGSWQSHCPRSFTRKLAAGQRGVLRAGKADGLTDVDVRYDEPGLSAGEREAYAAMLCDDEDDGWMETQTGLAIGPPAFVQRFTESGMLVENIQ